MDLTRQCTACPEGTFSSDVNQNACTPWTTCPSTLRQTGGSSTTDTFCVAATCDQIIEPPTQEEFQRHMALPFQPICEDGQEEKYGVPCEVTCPDGYDVAISGQPFVCTYDPDLDIDDWVGEFPICYSTLALTAFAVSCHLIAYSTNLN